MHFIHLFNTLWTEADQLSPSPGAKYAYVRSVLCATQQGER